MQIIEKSLKVGCVTATCDAKKKTFSCKINDDVVRNCAILFQHESQFYFFYKLILMVVTLKIVFQNSQFSDV